MEVRDLRSLLTVVRCGSFTAAAAELGYTQSAVSQQIAALEAELGHPLLQRRPVRPTPAGERLVEHASRILLRLDVARSELADLGPPPGEMVVAVCPLATPGLLASALRDVRAALGSWRVRVRSTDPATAVADVASGAVDLALVDGITGPDEPLHLADAGLLSSTALVETPLVVALATSHPLRRRKAIDLDVLADAPWIVASGLGGGAPPWPPPGQAPSPSLIYEGRDVLTLLSLVAAGLGAALLPASVGHPSDEVVTIPLRSPRLVHRTELLTLRSPSTHRRVLVDALRARAPLSADRAGG